MSRKGQYKAKGGTGSKVSRRNIRTIMPILQKIRAEVKGQAVSVYACAKCLKAGKVKKAA